jgi:hypothetical protein
LKFTLKTLKRIYAYANEKIWKRASVYINIKHLHNHAAQITNLSMYGKVYKLIFTIEMFLHIGAHAQTSNVAIFKQFYIYYTQ